MHTRNKPASHVTTHVFCVDSIDTHLKEETIPFVMHAGGIVKSWKKRWFVLSSEGRTLQYFDTATSSRSLGIIPVCVIRTKMSFTLLMDMYWRKSS
jgi:hypothetical protein